MDEGEYRKGRKQIRRVGRKEIGKKQGNGRKDESTRKRKKEAGSEIRRRVRQ